MRMPAVKLDACDRSAPNTATASAPPTCRHVLNTPLAVPANAPGTLDNSTAVTGGATNGPAKPTSTISAAIHTTGAVGGSSATAANPAAMLTRPLTIIVRALKRRTRRALNGVSTSPINIIGRKATPVSGAERPRCCCRYRLITNGRPK
ncbi:hypothetical protein G6F50_015569 [Rhizopus delemar]|uniref:Uncharacterized protein n=1 Tax=Rhizopus delemar TaxID=936053 RepID=A0A9P6XX94_9FUNG|nr:hypothetical protein G6F50_015569 [Rhizopus delemar]